VKKPKKSDNPKPAPRGIGYGPGDKEEASFYSPKSSAIIKTIMEIKQLVKSRMEKREGKDVKQEQK
jgi:hypothetical protein